MPKYTITYEADEELSAKNQKRMAGYIQAQSKQKLREKMTKLFLRLSLTEQCRVMDIYEEEVAKK